MNGKAHGLEIQVPLIADVTFWLVPTLCREHKTGDALKRKARLV